MECPNCAFQNAPGTQACLRCRSVMDFSGVEFLPPRAGDATLAMKARRRVDRVRGRFDRWSSDVARSLRVPSPDAQSWSAVASSILPGLGSIRTGNRALGWTLMSIWGAMLLLWLLTVGSGISWLFLGAAVSVHSTAFLLHFASAMQDRWLVARMLVGFGVYALVATVLYAPVGYALGRLVRVLPAVDVRANGVVRDGDVLLYSGAWTRPETFALGDVVVFEIRARAAGGVQLREGLGVDRILGRPGDRVTWQREAGGFALRINGALQPPSMYPIGGLRSVEPFDLLAAEGHYLLFPTSIAADDRRSAAYMSNLARDLARVDESAILGRVELRLRPWHRFGPIGLEPTIEGPTR